MVESRARNDHVRMATKPMRVETILLIVRLLSHDTLASAWLIPPRGIAYATLLAREKRERISYYGIVAKKRTC